MMFNIQDPQEATWVTLAW